MTNVLRDKLIDRLRNLPADKLPQIEAMLSHLECGHSLPLSLLDCGDSSPLFFLASPDIRSTTDQQRLAAQVA